MRNIFREKNLKKNWKKNTNMPKFIARIFMKYFYSYAQGKGEDKLIKYHKSVSQ
jgi:hypothetical protein